ncbi:MAG: TonB-dependent receptor [Sphingomonadales bacterium]|nr:TonB-dependent receptor [Sphingomonadales bacterium]
MFRKIVLITALLCWSTLMMAQNRFTLNGYIKDSLTGEVISGASVKINGQAKGILSNQFGFYSLTLEPGSYLLTFSHVSYQVQSISISIKNNETQNIDMVPRSAAIQEVVVFSKKRDGNITAAQLGKIDLSVNQIKSLPVLMGEVDILKTIQLLPGVRNAGEGNAGFYVRGGGPDQNLILLDDAVVYNTGHLFGFFSIFNGDAIRNLTLIKGGMPAQYGGRLSSVLDVSMKEGNAKEFQFDGGIGLIASRFSAQGPIEKGRSSFIVSGRRTYIDALITPFISKNSSFYGSGYYFYDLNAKFNHRFSKKDRLFISGYFGRDVFDFNNNRRSFSTSIPWGNATATVRWNHVFGPRLFANTTAVFNNYKFQFSARQDNFSVGLNSGIRDWSLKSDFDYYPLPGHKLKFGVMTTQHRFLPNVASGRQDSVVFAPNNEVAKYALESALYIQDDWELDSRWQFNYGVRYSRFTQTGPFTRYQRDVFGNKLDSMVYTALQPVVSYGGLEPRASFRYTIQPDLSIKASVSRNIQYIHLVSNAGTTLPTDLWVPSTYRVKPQLSWLYAAGVFKNFADNAIESSVEIYFKDMQNQIEYREGYTPSISDPETEFVFGKGWSYGAEWFINKVRGSFTGWVGYTLSWTWRKFPDLNEGQRYPARFDRRHDLSVVGNYALTKKWKMGAVFVYGTGNAISLPERFYVMNGVLNQEYSRINQYRMRSYHRLDLSMTYTPVPSTSRKVKSQWVFSIYNLYSRFNPYFIYFDQEGSITGGDLKVSTKQVSLFPILPSVTWNFSF